MKICVDTVILIDILKDEYPQTQEKFYHAFEAGPHLLRQLLPLPN